MDKHLGALEQMLMLATARLGENAHGLAIRQELAATVGRSISHGAVYTAMDRLADRDLVEAWIGNQTPESGGRKRRFYRLTPAGARLLAREMAGLAKLSRGVMPRIMELSGDVD